MFITLLFFNHNADNKDARISKICQYSQEMAKFTAAGFQKLEEEIQRIEDEISEAQGESAEIGETGGNQWHDNAAYDTLIADLGKLDKRLRTLQEERNEAEIVGPPEDFTGVYIGTRVEVLKDGDFDWFDIAGHGESDPDQGILAYDTPLASAMMGKQIGDEVQIELEGGSVTIEILDILDPSQED